MELEAAASREALEEGPNLYSFFVSFPDYGLPHSPPSSAVPSFLFEQRAYEVPSHDMW